MPLRNTRLPKLKARSRNKVPYRVSQRCSSRALFPNGGEVSIADLVNAGAVRTNQPVKVLAGTAKSQLLCR